MLRDALCELDTAHAYTAAALSEKSYDLGDVTPKRVIGAGEEVGVGFNVDVAADCTTVKFEVIQADDEALSQNVVVLDEQTRLAADCPAGALIFMAFPPQAPAAGARRFVGTRITPAGGNATVTVSSAIGPRSMFSAKPVHYADAVTIS